MSAPEARGPEDEDYERTWRSALRQDSGKLRVAVGVELLQIDILIRQAFEPDGAEERLDRLDQQDRLGKAAVVEAAAEMHARLDRERLEGRHVEAEPAQRTGLHHLYEVAAQHQHVAAAEFHDDTELAFAFAGGQHGPLDTH